MKDVSNPTHSETLHHLEKVINHIHKTRVVSSCRNPTHITCSVSHVYACKSLFHPLENEVTRQNPICNEHFRVGVKFDWN